MNPPEKTLEELCEQLGIPKKTLTTEDFDRYRESHPSQDYLFGAFREVNRIMESNTILMGGFSAHPKLLGHRNLRRCSNDMDCVTNEKGVEKLYEEFGDRLFITTNYGDLFLDFAGVPFGFDIGETHGWDIPNEFYEESIAFELEGEIIRTISPEYLITLKGRRSSHAGRIYGKDISDIANLLLAQRFRGDLRAIDYKKIRDLSREHIEDQDSFREFVVGLDNAQRQLKKNERSIFLEEHCKLLREVLGTSF